MKLYEAETEVVVIVDKICQIYIGVGVSNVSAAIFRGDA